MKENTMQVQFLQPEVQKGFQLLEAARNDNTTALTINVENLFHIVLKQQEMIKNLTEQSLLRNEEIKQEEEKRQQILSQFNSYTAHLSEENKALNDRVNVLVGELREARAEISTLNDNYKSLKEEYDKHIHTHLRYMVGTIVSGTPNQYVK